MAPSPMPMRWAASGLPPKAYRRRPSALWPSSSAVSTAAAPATAMGRVRRTGSAPSALAKRASTTESLHHDRSEEHTSELQSHSDLACRLLLEKTNRYDP